MKFNSEEIRDSINKLKEIMAKADNSFKQKFISEMIFTLILLTIVASLFVEMPGLILEGLFSYKIISIIKIVLRILFIYWVIRSFYILLRTRYLDNYDEIMNQINNGTITQEGVNFDTSTPTISPEKAQVINDNIEKSASVVVRIVFLVPFLAFLSIFMVNIVALFFLLKSFKIDSIIFGFTLVATSVALFSYVFVRIFSAVIFNWKFSGKKAAILILFSVFAFLVGFSESFIYAARTETIPYDTSMDKVYTESFEFTNDLLFVNTNATYGVDLIIDNSKNDVTIRAGYDADHFNIQFTKDYNKMKFFVSLIEDGFPTSAKYLFEHLKKGYFVERGNYSLTLTTNEDNIKQIIKNTSYRNYVVVKELENGYHITIDEEYSPTKVCEINDYLYSCASIINSSAGVELTDFAYTNDEFIYDQNKYICTLESSYRLPRKYSCTLN